MKAGRIKSKTRIEKARKEYNSNGHQQI